MLPVRISRRNIRVTAALNIVAGVERNNRGVTHATPSKLGMCEHYLINLVTRKNFFFHLFFFLSSREIATLLDVVCSTVADSASDSSESLPFR
jgi:hypothetical protein